MKAPLTKPAAAPPADRVSFWREIARQHPSMMSGSVLIVGAGMAGLTAANVLKAFGIRTTILEARNRVGGRIQTDHSWPGIPIDLGASWLNGASTNPLLALAHDLRVSTSEAAYDEISLVYDAKGALIPRHAWAKVRQQAEAILDQSAELRRTPRRNSLGDALSALIDRHRWPEEMQRYVKHYVHTMIEQEFATDIADMCWREWYDFADFGEGHRVFPDGFDEITEKLARGLDIRLEHVVERVEHGEGGVRIVTQRGTFTADRAVITLPLGILQSGRVAFSPPLPTNKMDAIRRLGMGVLNKVVLRFPACFWPRESEWLEYAGERTGEWALYFNLFKHSGKPVLVGLNSGRFARELEAVPDRQLVDQCMDVLRTMFGPRIPAPDASLVTRWASDPFSLGSYSYIPSGGSGADMDALAEPVGGRLYFAGEATFRAQYATVQGAFFSGFRAAGEIAVPESAQFVASLGSELYHRSPACLDAQHIAAGNRIRGLFAKQGRILHSGCT